MFTGTCENLALVALLKWNGASYYLWYNDGASYYLWYNDGFIHLSLGLRASESLVTTANDGKKSLALYFPILQIMQKMFSWMKTFLCISDT